MNSLIEHNSRLRNRKAPKSNRRVIETPLECRIFLKNAKYCKKTNIILISYSHLRMRISKFLKIIKREKRDLRLPNINLKVSLMLSRRFEVLKNTQTYLY
jgi:hypothetical protein